MPAGSSQFGPTEFLSAALDASGQCVWEWNLASGAIERAAGFAPLLGYQPPEIDGRPWFDLVHRDDRLAVQRLLDDHLAGRSRHFEAEMRLRKSDGAFLRVLTRGRVTARDEAGHPLRLAGAHFDISGRAGQEQRLSQARKIEAVGLFAAGIAHDFNNLLTVISGYSELLGERPLSEECRGFLAPIRSASAIGASLVRRLLLFSRRRAQEPARVDLNAIVRELGAMFQRFLPENIRVLSHLDPALGSVVADAGSLEQVLMNLVLNARDAMPQGGTLEIRTANLSLPPGSTPQSPPAGNYVALAVIDTGAGMDERTRERAFEPFHTTRASAGGSGLGLSNVYGIVKQCGGWISVRSEEGAGTAIRIYLPRVEGEPAAPAAAPPETPQPGSESVLVVEDSAEVRKYMRAALEGLGYRVAEAGGREEAVNVFQKLAGRIDVLIADAVLPDGLGADLARQLTAARPDLGVLHISGYIESATAGGEGPVGFLAKPFTGQLLGAKVREVLRKRRPRRVLVAEHETPVARQIEQTLRQAGCEVTVAESSEAALAIAESRALDLVITDLLLPGQDGIELIIALRRLHPTLPVVAICGEPGDQLLKMAAALGARESLRKPFSAAALLDLVRSTLGLA